MNQLNQTFKYYDLVDFNTAKVMYNIIWLNIQHFYWLSYPWLHTVHYWTKLDPKSEGMRNVLCIKLPHSFDRYYSNSLLQNYHSLCFPWFSLIRLHSSGQRQETEQQTIIESATVTACPLPLKNSMRTR